jgi:hypothetical protein
MSLQDWIHHYPRVQALLQQAASEEPPEACRTRLYDSTPLVDPFLPRWLPQFRFCGVVASCYAQDGTPFCADHFARICVYRCCDTLRPPPYSNEWSSANEMEYWQTDYAWCRVCYARDVGLPASDAVSS